MVAVLSALGSALLVALASVLQHRAGANAAAPTLRSAVRQPAWLLGGVCGLSGFALHVLALSAGALVIVQPLLVSGLLFALPMSAALERRPIGRRSALAAAAVVGGLALFQLAGRPSAGRSLASTSALLIGAAAVVCVAALVLALAVRRPHLRAICLGFAAGAAYGVVAALLKAALGALASPTSHVLAQWPIYGFVGLVTAAIAVNQMAFNAGPLALSLPLITVIDPLVSVILGSAVFGERTATSPVAVMGQVAGFAVMTLGVVALARLTPAAVAPHSVVGQAGSPVGLLSQELIDSDQTVAPEL